MTDLDPGKRAIRHSERLEKSCPGLERPQAADSPPAAPATRSSWHPWTGGSTWGQFRGKHPAGRIRCEEGTIPLARAILEERGTAPSETCDVRCGSSC